MKRKLLLTVIAFCMGSSLLLTLIRAEDKDYHGTTKAKTDSIDFKEHMNVSQLLHSKVLDKSGQKIGTLEDIMLDPESCRIQFAVLKLSGDLADNGKYAPVPFSLLKLSDVSTKGDMFGHHDLTLQTDRDKLMSASKFNVKSWPDRECATLWGPDVYSHYGVAWDSKVARGASMSFESSTGSGSSGRDVNPLDNGTGPDGKDIFHVMPRPWPYNQLPDYQYR